MIHQREANFEHFKRLIDSGLTDAVFDLENTVVRSSIAYVYLFMKEKQFASKWTFGVWKAASLCLLGPWYLALDCLDRERFQKAFYRRFETFSRIEVCRWGAELAACRFPRRMIPYVHDLIFFLTARRVRVHILSTSIEPVVRPVAAYFNVTYHCLKVRDDRDNCVVDLTDLPDFKRRFMSRFDPETTMAVADSRHDLPVLSYVKYPMVVSTREKRWMKSLNGGRIAGNALHALGQGVE